MQPELSSPLIIHTIVSGVFAANSFVLHTQTEDQAIVIDPCDAADAICAYLKQHKLQLSCILLTHGHIDHISSTATLTKCNAAPVWIHGADAYLLDDLPFWADYFKLAPPEPILKWNALSDGQQFPLGKGSDLQTLHTPGHTPGSVCFQLGQHLWTGDTLFQHGVGRTDLKGGDEHLLQQSLTRLLALPAATICHPGHGPDTTIGDEQRNHFFI